jgi:hypothetical protein
MRGTMIDGAMSLNGWERRWRNKTVVLERKQRSHRHPVETATAAANFHVISGAIACLHMPMSMIAAARGPSAQITVMCALPLLRAGLAKAYISLSLPVPPTFSNDTRFFAKMPGPTNALLAGLARYVHPHRPNSTEVANAHHSALKSE